jgi:hypothetical protein
VAGGTKFWVRVTLVNNYSIPKNITPLAIRLVFSQFRFFLTTGEVSVDEISFFFNFKVVSFHSILINFKTESNNDSI